MKISHFGIFLVCTTKYFNPSKLFYIHTLYHDNNKTGWDNPFTKENIPSRFYFLQIDKIFVTTRTPTLSKNKGGLQRKKNNLNNFPAIRFNSQLVAKVNLLESPNLCKVNNNDSESNYNTIFDNNIIFTDLILALRLFYRIKREEAFISDFKRAPGSGISSKNLSF